MENIYRIETVQEDKKTYYCVMRDDIILYETWNKKEAQAILQMLETEALLFKAEILALRAENKQLSDLAQLELG